MIKLFVKPAAAALCAAALLASSPAIASPALTTLFSFTDVASGQNPMGALVFGPDGALYGTTAAGGSGCFPLGCGVVFKLTSPAAAGAAWTETVLHSFTGSDGSVPQGDLVFDAAGNLYGTTSQGGLDHGVVFSLSPPADPNGTWTETVLHSFTGLEDGNDVGPSLAIDASGALYGVTQFNSTGAGTVFQLRPPRQPGDPWQHTVLWVFGGDGDGAHPLGGVVLGPRKTLYGTTYDRGAFGTGAVYKLQFTHAGISESVIHSFPALRTTGGFPVAPLVIDPAGALYGTTFMGGLGDDGVAFSLAPSGRHWTAAVLHKFADNGKDGFRPTARLLLDPSGVLYGTTPVGGISDAGTVYELLPPTSAGGKWGETVLWNFHGLPVGGNSPQGGVIEDAAGALYGTTAVGGTHCTPPTGCGGTVFMLTP